MHCIYLINPKLGICYSSSCIGRVCSNTAYRKGGYGRRLLAKSIEVCQVEFSSDCSIEIGAQYYLKTFYESFGFIQQGDVYIEDDIEHVHMIREGKKNTSNND